MLKEFRQVCEGYQERKGELLKGLADGSLKYPSHIQDLMVEWEAQRREQDAAQKALDAAAALQKAEDNEAEAESYTPKVEPDTHVGDQPVDVAIRRAPSKAWYASSVGKQKVQEVVGTLSEPLPDLINGLSGLSKALDDQNRHASVMHNYAEFWAGYDRFFYTESTHRAKWGRAGRLERMRKLRSVLREVASKLDVYISVTTPPADIQYPEN
jgi:murein L,D-transpeptidase YcbB/YkuD